MDNLLVSVIFLALSLPALTAIILMAIIFYRLLTVHSEFSTKVLVTSLFLLLFLYLLSFTVWLKSLPVFSLIWDSQLSIF